MKPVLVLSSWGTGSTYFQRAATFWIHQLIDSSITNPHDLLNGIVFENEHLIKQWMAYSDQSLDDIIKILKDNTHPILCRIAHNHMIARNESVENLDKFYNFISDYFDVYACTRSNIFEYAMCWGIREQTKRKESTSLYTSVHNNVYSSAERETVYGDRFVVKLDDIGLKVNEYNEYLEWINLFNPTIIDYDDLQENIDVILQELFPAEQSISDVFGISLAEYSIYKYNNISHPSLGLIDDKINYLCKNKILLDPIPIKSTTMSDKLSKIENFDQCLNEFNKVSGQSLLSNSDINDRIITEGHIYK